MGAAKSGRWLLGIHAQQKPKLRRHICYNEPQPFDVDGGLDLSGSDSEIVDLLVRGAIDFHVHAAPDAVQKRRLNCLELAYQAKGAGMRAVVMKSHHFGTAPLAYLVNQVVPDFTLVGSLVLNSAVGGLNPEAVAVALRMGARVIWMPTYSSMADNERRRANAAVLPQATRTGITLFDKGGKLLPRVISILEVVKEANAILGTGHISVPEVYALVTQACRMGVKVTVTHPLNESYGSRLSLKQQLELASQGALLEHCFLDCVPPYGRLAISVLARHIKTVGAEHCLLCTDFGQYQNPTPLEGFRIMLANLLEAGISEAELGNMVKTNPARLLNLD